MAADLIVISSTELPDLSEFNLQKIVDARISNEGHDQEIRTYLNDLQFHEWKMIMSNDFGFREVMIKTGLDYCLDIRLHHGIISFQPSGFRTRFSSWIRMFDKSVLPSAEELTYWGNWSDFHRLVYTLTNLLGGEVVVYIDDASLQLEDGLLDDGNGFYSFFAAMRKHMESWPLEYLELYAEEFVSKPCFFFEEIEGNGSRSKDRTWHAVE